MNYNHQKAIVVGASGGIGRAIAQELLAGGCDLVACYRQNLVFLDDLFKQASIDGRLCMPMELDLTNRASLRRALTSTAEQVGIPSILINAAGVRIDRPLLEMTDHDWDIVVDTNLNGAFALTRDVGRMMMGQRTGRIINIGSVSALQAVPGQANYSASKAGLIALTRVAAREFGPFGITVNAIAPGVIETAMTDSLPASVKRQYLSRIPLRRFGRPADIVPIVRMLLAPEAEYVTGQVITVDGGLTA
jgi:3-oxoacyl-[acyl-carrier protein] reductase